MDSKAIRIVWKEKKCPEFLFEFETKLQKFHK